MKILGLEYLSKEQFLADKSFEQYKGGLYISDTRIAQKKWMYKTLYIAVAIKDLGGINIARRVNHYNLYAGLCARLSLEDARKTAAVIFKKYQAITGKDLEVIEYKKPDIRQVADIDEPDGCIEYVVYIIVVILYHWILAPIINYILRSVLPKHQ